MEYGAEESSPRKLVWVAEKVSARGTVPFAAGFFFRFNRDQLV
jgi:hypothetical protein